MILIISRSSNVTNCSALLQKELSCPVVCVNTFGEAHMELQEKRFSVVVLEDWDWERETAAVDHLFQNLKSAAPIFVDFSITSAERLLRLLKAVLQRRERELTYAHEQAAAQLAADIGDELTALALICGGALPEGKESTELQLKSAQQVLQNISARLKPVRAGAAHA